MAGTNVTWLQELFYYFVSSQELKNDFGTPAVKKADFINRDFLNEVSNYYHSDIYRNLDFHYYTSDTFNAKLNTNTNIIDFSLFHINIHSLNKNNDELCQFLHTVNHDFDVLVLSEIWSYNVIIVKNLAV